MVSNHKDIVKPHKGVVLKIITLGTGDPAAFWLKRKACPLATILLARVRPPRVNLNNQIDVQCWFG